MDTDADLRAYEELASHPRARDLRATATAVLRAIVEKRRADPEAGLADRIAAENDLARDAATTSFGNALDVLGRGPTDDAERSLARALAALALAQVDDDPGDEARTATALLWLAAQSAFDGTGLVDRAFGARSAPLLEQIADRLRRYDAGDSVALGKPEAIVAAATIAASRSPSAARLGASLASDLRDPKLRRALGDGARPSAVAPLVGEWTPSPRSSIVAALLGVTGLSLLLHGARLVGRIALAYRRPAEVALSDDGGVRVRWRVEVLGRTLHDKDVLVPRAGLVRATREVRYPRLALYSGLLSLAVGSYVGMRLLVDGVRTASPSLMVTGLAVVATGLALDLGLTSLAPGAKGRCRVLFLQRRGSPLCVGSVDVASADAMLARLARE